MQAFSCFTLVYSLFDFFSNFVHELILSGVHTMLIPFGGLGLGFGIGEDGISPF